MNVAGQGKFLHNRKDRKELMKWRTEKRTMDFLSMMSTPIVMKMKMMKLRWMMILVISVVIVRWMMKFPMTVLFLMKRTSLASRDPRASSIFF